MALNLASRRTVCRAKPFLPIMLSLVNVSSFFTQSKGGGSWWGRARAFFLFSRLEHAAGMLRLQKQELEVLDEQNF